MYVEFNVPDVDGFPNGFPSYWSHVLFIGVLTDIFQINALATTYVRLVEAALVEHKLGKAHLLEYWSTRSSINLSAMNRSVSHFESCLSDMHRAINCFTRLRGHKFLPKGLKLILSEDQPRFVANYVAGQLRNIRNEIHHLEELVMDGRYEQGQPIALQADGPEVPHATEANQTIKTIDRLKIAGRELSFSDLAAWLTEMGRFAEKLGAYQKQQHEAKRRPNG